jgi:hypothetical protein
MTSFQPGDKVVDKLSNINHGQPMNLTKVDGDIATVEYFDADREGFHVVLEVNISSLEKVR